MQLYDQIGKVVNLEGTPQRIVSLVPSQTELLLDLGLGERIVGCTKFCVHPAQMPQWVKRIGGTKNPNIQKIAAIRPDLIIANKEENTQESIAQLSKICPVWVSDVNSIEDALSMISEIGKITDTQAKSEAISLEIKVLFQNLSQYCSSLPTLKVAYLIWFNPIMVAGTNNFINSILSALNLKNPWESSPQRYPQVSIEELQDAQPDYLILSSEPYPFNQENCNQMLATFHPAGVTLADGEMFSWYGSRMRLMKDYLLNFRKLLAQNAR